MTLYIIDNGEKYSDHTVYFIETDEPIDVVTALLGIPGETGQSILAVTDSVTWLSADISAPHIDLVVRNVEKRIEQLRPFRANETVRQLIFERIKLWQKRANARVAAKWKPEKTALICRAVEQLTAFMEEV